MLRPGAVVLAVRHRAVRLIRRWSPRTRAEKAAEAARMMGAATT